MSIKDSADEWVRKGPTQAIAVVAAVGLVIGGLIGVGVGYKVEQSRIKSDVKKLQTRLRAATVPATNGKRALGQRVGTVTTTSGANITLTTKKRGAQVLVTNPSTVFETAVRGTIADVRSGRRVLITAGGNEIVVLPVASKLGRVVSAVASDFIKVAAGNGAPASRIDTPKVHRVETLKPAKFADVGKDDKVLAGGRATNGDNFAATEVIVLPADSGFTN
jgi:hypothetical protein